MSSDAAVARVRVGDLPAELQLKLAEHSGARSLDTLSIYPDHMGILVRSVVGFAAGMCQTDLIRMVENHLATAGVGARTVPRSRRLELVR